jgi:hypothetical protein
MRTIFFRNIRRGLLNKRMLSKYTIYALGEILLVVAGILIALQVNNWNEGRKERNKEIALLSEIRENLLITRSDIEKSLKLNYRNLKLYRYLDSVVHNDLKYTTRMDTAFGHLPYWDTPYLTETAYQNMKNTDINIIRNDTLRQLIVDVHENNLVRIKNDWDRWEWDINQSIVMPFFADHIKGSMEDRYIARPNNFEELKNNEIFSNILSILFRTRIWGIMAMEEAVKKIDSVIERINGELKPS